MLVGDFIYNKLNGIGEYYRNDGSIYKGFFENDKINGRGRLLLINKYIYEGDFVDELFNGFGKIYSLNNKVNKDKIYIEELKNIMYICFNNNTNSGIFKIDILPHIMNNKLRFSSNFNELSYSFIEKKNEFTEIISINNPTILYLNLILGNSSFYYLNNSDEYLKNLNEISEQNKIILNNNFQIINETAVIKIKINSYSLYEYFIQQVDKIFDVITFGKNIKYFRENRIYNILILDLKCLIKLLTPEKEVKFYNKNQNFILNNNQVYIHLDKGDFFYIEGKNSLVSFYYQLSQSEDFLICNEEMKEYNDVKETFIIFNKTNLFNSFIYNLYFFLFTAPFMSFIRITINVNSLSFKSIFIIESQIFI